MTRICVKRQVFFGGLAKHLGLEKGQRRFICIMRQERTPRLGIRVRLWLDMTLDDEFDTNVRQLTSELRQPNMFAVV